MRVISQHGGADLPYEQIVVRHEMEYVIAVHKEKEYVLGKYSSDEKAVKAMEMLRDRYSNSDYIQFRAETMVGDANSAIKKFMIDITYFQFPKDDEVEV